MLPFATTIFLGAFLLFQVQPLLGRIIVPWFGGGPAVWMTCMLFFQTLLLGGYLYAHLLSSRLAPRKQCWIHIALLILSFLFLPIYPNPAWKISTFGPPALRILLLLTCTIGLPGLAIASTGPLLQRWFVYQLPGRSPYRLYSLSNIGSVLALVTYPFLIEPSLGSHMQANSWSMLFLIYAAACGMCAWKMGAASETGRIYVNPGDPQPEAVAESDEKPGAGKIALWLALSAIGSVHLLAGTNQLCQEVAAVPFLWVLPLTVYLATFILAFDTPSRITRWIGAAAILGGAFWLGWHFKLVFHQAEDDFGNKYFESPSPYFYCLLGAAAFLAASVAIPRERQWYNRWAGLILLLSAMPLAAALLYKGVVIPLQIQVAGYLFVIFACCMVCNGELARSKPAASGLTLYYLMMSAGGALGGCFVALAAPLLFTDYLEYPISLAATALAAILIWLTGMRGGEGPRWPAAAWFGALSLWLIGCLALGYISDLLVLKPEVATRWGLKANRYPFLSSWRGFYGVLHVFDDRDNELSESMGRDIIIRTLRNGRIMHGIEYMDPELRMRPLSYYAPESGIGLAIRNHPHRDAPDPEKRDLRIGAIGQGIGTLLGLTSAGDTLRYYEINPQVIEVANAFFYFTRGTPSHYESALGDGRISMERELREHGSDRYDVIVVDAFTSDAIPMHLLTSEAAHLYWAHLQPDGMLAMHITNRYIDLQPVVDGMAKTLGCKEVTIDIDADDSKRISRSRWVILTNNQAWIDNPVVKAVTETPDPNAAKPVVWTDDNASLWRLLRF